MLDVPSIQSLLSEATATLAVSWAPMDDANAADVSRAVARVLMVIELLRFCRSLGTPRRRRVRRSITSEKLAVCIGDLCPTERGSLVGATLPPLSGCT